VVPHSPRSVVHKEGVETESLHGPLVLSATNVKASLNEDEKALMRQTFL
jgi:hypothetical protein